MSQFRLSQPSQRPIYKRTRSERKEITCSHCQQIQAIPVHVNSWACTHCGHRLEFGERIIRNGEQMGIQTYGGIILPPKIVYAGTHIQAAWMRLAGTSLGSLVLENRLIVEGEAKIKNWVKTDQLEILRDGELSILHHPIECKQAKIEGKIRAKQWLIDGRLEIMPGAVVEVEYLSFGELNIQPGAIVHAKKIRCISSFKNK